MKEVRVRFAPSPTGGLHLGGIRTVLYNYLFARQHHGTLILRIEDTDQNRYVPGAEDYIFECLEWCGLQPDESPRHQGPYGPYRQSERKSIYRQYAEQLVRDGFAYYAFDTPAELEEMRAKYKTDTNPSPQYDQTLRSKMRNSLTLDAAEVSDLVSKGVRHVVRVRMPENETVRLNDMIRGEVEFNTSLVDDKVLLKADGMPTYHLAVVVDDYLMKISHAFRGEEWLPSAPVHVLLWKYLGWEKDMPAWAHLPLILGPQGKLSKRDALKYGFPVFAMNWKDPATGELTEGFREKGFLPAAFVNFLALLGWNDGSDQEIFTLEELVSRFSLDRVHASGAKFDYEKAKWFNHEWIKRSDDSIFIQQLLAKYGGNPGYAAKVVTLVKDRCVLLTDLFEQSSFFFEAPSSPDFSSIRSKWNDAKAGFFRSFADEMDAIDTWEAAFIEDAFRKLAMVQGIKPGELQLPFRIMLVGGRFGPPVFDIAAVIGREETVARVRKSISLI